MANSPVGGGTVVTQYIYDAEGNRVAKGSTGSFTCDTSGNSGTFVVAASYGLDQGGSAITEYDQNGNWVRSEVSAAGQLIATYKNDNLGVHFHVADWLGTRRIQTDYAGVHETSFTNAPFGDSFAQYGPSGAIWGHDTYLLLAKHPWYDLLVSSLREGFVL